MFDPVERARDLFEALDVDGDGAVTEEEFITGCLKDEAFIMLLERFSGDDIWGIWAPGSNIPLLCLCVVICILNIASHYAAILYCPLYIQQENN